MNFRSFIYYCALCGAWAAFVAWALITFSGIYDRRGTDPSIYTAATGAAVGVLVGGIVGLLDAMLNSTGFSRLVRTFICMALGGFFSMVGSLLGNVLLGIFHVKFLGWAIAGAAIGASLGAYDLFLAMGKGAGAKQAIRKIINGVIGGVIGGALGGFLNDALGTIPWPVKDEFGQMVDLKDKLPKSSLATGLVILGACIGLLIGAAQVVLKQAWVRVEQGFKAGREMILSKPNTTVGRAEGSDIALFGDQQCEKTHARIVLKGDRYVLVDNGTPGGTFLNGQKIAGQAMLKSGDLIGCGKSLLRFEERAKRK